MRMTYEIQQKVVIGAVGFLTSVMLSIPAYIAQIETALKLVSLSLSIAVAIFTLFKLSNDYRNGRRKKTTKKVQ
jgi:4-hydroxybenzoate polyprenyltransferase